MAPDSIRKQLVNIRKTQERQKKRKKDRSEDNDSDEEQEEKFSTQIERYGEI